VLLVLALVVMHNQGEGSAVRCLLAFGGTATLAAILGGVQARTFPRPLRARQWLVDHSSLSVRYLAENVSISGASQIRSFVVGGVVSLAAVGQVRAAEMLMGPFLVILMGMSQVAVPEASHILRTAPERLGRFCLMFGTLQSTAAAAWGGMMLLLLPHGLGDALLGSLWQPVSVLLPAVILGMCFGGFEVGAAAGVRALGAARRSLRAQLSFSALYLLGGAVGAVVAGAQGTCVGVAIATGLGAVVWWYQLQRARAEHAQVREVGPA
jgi:O-antigen/teichoic acid export membrane protein